MDLTNVKDFEQKVRNKARAITDVAISKVRRTRIPGFDNQQNKFIQDCHKKLLKDAQKLNKQHNTNKMEVGYLIDIHHWNKPWIIEGKRECEVEMKDNPEALKYLLTSRKNQLMFMHNHPSTGTFSGEDFKTFCNNDSLYMMTVIGNDASIYLLIKKRDFDSSTALEKYGELAIYYLEKGFKNNATYAMKELLKNAGRYGLVYKKGRV